MRIFNIFVDIFCVLAFLTLGSLMLIVSLRILPMEDALIKVQMIYENSMQRYQVGITGFVLIVVGLSISKMMLKKMRSDDEFIFESESGYVTLTYSVINELTERALRKFEVIRHSDIATRYEQGEIKIMIDLTVVPGWNLSELVRAVEQEVKERIQKTLGSEMNVSINASVTKIKESPFEIVR